MSSIGKLYGNIFSTCTRIVLMTAAELNADVELVPVDLMKGQHKQTEHLKRQPFGKIPAFVDNHGFTLFESRAIARYIAQQYGDSNIYPKDPKKRAIVDQWLSVEQGTVNGYLCTILAERILNRHRGLDTDQKNIDKAINNITPYLDVLDKHLAENKYMSGTEFTLADIVYLPYLQLLSTVPEWSLIKDRKNLLRWWEDISNRPAWKSVLAKQPAH